MLSQREEGEEEREGREIERAISPKEKEHGIMEICSLPALNTHSSCTQYFIKIINVAGYNDK